MAFKYKEVVPWGRNFDEYIRMFDLTTEDLSKKILGCGDGPASFNSHCNRNGGDVISVDPIYEMTRQEIEQRIQETYDTVLSQTKENTDLFKWDRIKSVEALGDVRMKAMLDFLDSFEAGLETGTYLAGSLPNLPFSDKQFDISLSSHFLFLYTQNLSYSFHVEAIEEMLRVSGQARIFPLLDVNGKTSSYLNDVINHFNHYSLEIRTVDYEFQIGGNKLLVIGSL